MNSKMKKSFIFFVLILVVILLHAGCAGSPIRRANLTVYVVPNPVYHSYDWNWYYNLYIKESSGASVTLNSLIFQDYNSYNQLVKTQYLNTYDIAKWFGTYYVSGSSTIWCRLNDPVASRYSIITIEGRDAYGNFVSATVRLNKL